MKLKALFYLFLLLLIACSKDDEEGMGEPCVSTDLGQCYQIPAGSITDIKAYNAYDLLQNQNGNFTFYTSDDNQLVQVDENLNVVWVKTFNHLDKIDVSMEGLTQNESGELVMVSNEFTEVSRVAKVAEDGSLLWVVPYADDNNPFYRTITNAYDGGYILSGSVDGESTTWQPLVTKIDEEGNEVWTQILPAAQPDIIHASVRFQGRHLVVGADAGSGNGRELFYNIIDDGGTYGIRTPLGFESGWSMKAKPTSDNGFIVISSFRQSEEGEPSDTDYQVIKVNSMEEIEWTNYYGGDKRELPQTIIESQNGGYYALGVSKSYGYGDWDLFLVKIDDSGNIVWQNTYGSADYEFGGTLLELNNGDLIIVGATGSDPRIFLMKLDENGVPK